MEIPKQLILRRFLLRFWLLNFLPIVFIEATNSCGARLGEKTKAKKQKPHFAVRLVGPPRSRLAVPTRLHFVYNIKNFNEGRRTVAKQNAIVLVWGKQKSKSPTLRWGFYFLWALPDSNGGPPGYEPEALTNWAKGPDVNAEKRLSAALRACSQSSHTSEYAAVARLRAALHLSIFEH